MLRLMDSHCHFDFSDFDEDRDEVWQAALSAGVTRIVIPGVRATTWDRLLQLCRASKGLYAALGLHPYFIDEHKDEHLEQLRHRLISHANQIMAVGEIGVDARKPDLDRQWQLFRAQLDLGQEVAKPLIIHSVKTHDEVYAELKRRDLPSKGVIHAFSGSYQQAKHFVDLGFKLGVGGVITFERAHKTREAIRQMPSHALVLESDAPDMAMAGHQGQRNSPQWLPEVLHALAELRNEASGVLAETLWKNACELYGLESGEEVSPVERAPRGHEVEA